MIDGSRTKFEISNLRFGDIPRTIFVRDGHERLYVPNKISPNRYDYLGTTSFLLVLEIAFYNRSTNKGTCIK